MQYMIPEEFETIMQLVLGRDKYYLPNSFEYLDFKNYKEHLVKLLKILMYSVEKSIKYADSLLYEEILVTIHIDLQTLSKSKDYNELSSLVIATLARVSFLLLGNVPLHSDERISKEKKYTLNEFRTLQYVQTNEQKKNSIFYAIEHGYVNDEDAMKIKNKWNKCKYNSDIFIEGIRTNMPHIYAKLF